MLTDNYKKKGAPVTQQELNKVLRQHQAYLKLQGGLRAQLRQANLDGLIMANENLSEADFTGASLVGASLYASNLQKAALYCADLTDCDLRFARLVRADMRGCVLRGARLAEANLDHADLRSGRMMIVDAGGAVAMQGNNGAMSVDFSNCSLRGASFGNAKLDGADFSGALLRGANFKGAELKNAKFANSILTGVNLADLKVPPDALVGCIRDVSPEALAKAAELKSLLESHQGWIATQGSQGKPAILDGADLRPLYQIFANRRLGGLSARKTLCIEMDFSGSELQAAKFDGADLRGANFSKANLRGASFKDAILTHAVFEDADLRALPLSNGGSLAPNFAGAIFSENQFLRAMMDERPLPSAS